MEQRISLITLGVADMAASAAFYQALGWAQVDSPDGVVVFDLIGQTLAYIQRRRWPKTWAWMQRISADFPE